MNNLHWRTIRLKISDRNSGFPEIFRILQFTPYSFEDAWNTNCFKTTIIKNDKTWCKPCKTSLLWLQRLALLTRILVAVTAPFFVQKLRFYSSLKRTNEKNCSLQWGRAGYWWASRPISNELTNQTAPLSCHASHAMSYRTATGHRRSEENILHFPFP